MVYQVAFIELINYFFKFDLLSVPYARFYLHINEKQTKNKPNQNYTKLNQALKIFVSKERSKSNY